MKRLGAALLIFLAVYFIFLIRQDIIDCQDLKRQKQTVAENLAREEKKHLDLQKENRNLQENSGIEMRARTKLGLIKKGETAYKVLEVK